MEGGLSVSRLPIPSSGFLPLIRAACLLLSTPPHLHPLMDGGKLDRSEHGMVVVERWGERRGGVGARRRREG